MNSSMVIGDLIGQGTHSRAYSILQPETGEEYCLKIIREASLSEQSIRTRYEKYTKLLMRYSHPFLLRVFAVQRSEEKNVFMVITEKCEMTLDDYLEKNDLSLSRIKRFAAQILLLIEYFRKKKKSFNGIHPSKILIRKDGSLCLKEPNFLIYKKRDISAAHLTTDIDRYLRSFTFLSPELTQGGRDLDFYSDLWSLGVLIFYMITKRVPYHCETPFLLFPKIRDHDIDWGDQLKNYDDDDDQNESIKWDINAKDVIRQLLRFEKEQRIGMKKLFVHPFFNKEIRRLKREIRTKRNLKLQSIKDERERILFLSIYLEDKKKEENGHFCVHTIEKSIWISKNIVFMG